MPFALYDHVNAHGENEIAAWTRDLQTPDRAKLANRLDKLRQLGLELLPEILTGTDTPGILKLRVRGKVQLRPMLCKGPIGMNEEFTLLLGAKEVGGKLVPRHADALADDIRQKVKADPANRRKEHEHVR